MAGNYSLVTTVSTGGTILASDRNTEHQNHINNMTPAGVDDYSATESQMQSTADPYPAAAVSQPTALSGELERIRYLIKQISGKSQWYVDAAAIGSKGSDVASASALTLGTDGNFFDITGTTAITSIGTLGVGTVVRLQFDSTLTLTHHATDLILPGGVNIRTRTGDVATFVEYASGDWFLVSFSRGPGHDLSAYRRPNLTFVSTTTVDVENNTGTQHQTRIIFPDGEMREVTENTGSTTVYRRFDITATATFASGTIDSGLRSGISEATNTWYAIFAVKCTKAGEEANFILAGDTTFPTQGNYSTLNTRYGTNGWVHLGYIRNGDNGGSTGDILNFVQSGNTTYLINTLADASISALSTASSGTLLANTTGATTLTYTYSAGSGTTNIPDTIKTCLYNAMYAAVAGNIQAYDSGGTRVYLMHHANTAAAMHRVWMAASEGIQLSNGPASSIAYTISLGAFVDGALAAGSNPLL